MCAFLYDDMPMEAAVRGRRLISLENGITSELGGLSRQDGGRNTWKATGGVKMYEGSGKRSEATFKSTGRIRNDTKQFNDTDPTRSDRGDYVVASWERGGKKAPEPVRKEEKPVGLHHVQQRDVEVAPFATDSDANPIPFHRQRRYVNVPGADGAKDEQEYVPKRSRTPPASVKTYCEKEGFTVIYSTNTSEKQKHVAGGARMIPSDHHGKGTTTTAASIANQRELAEKKRDAAFLTHRQYLREVTEKMVKNQLIRPHGKRIGMFHPDEREGGPNALGLSLPSNYIVGKSSARCRTPPAGAAAASGSSTSKPSWRR